MPLPAVLQNWYTRNNNRILRIDRRIGRRDLSKIGVGLWLGLTVQVLAAQLFIDK